MAICSCGSDFTPNSYRQTRCNECRFAPAKHPKAKIKESDVRVIRQRFKSKDHPSVIAADYGIHRTEVLHICAHRTWRHVS